MAIKNRHYLENRTSTTEQEKNYTQTSASPKIHNTITPDSKDRKPIPAWRISAKFATFKHRLVLYSHPETQELNVQTPYKGNITYEYILQHNNRL